MIKKITMAACLLWLMVASTTVSGATTEELQQQVMETERAFAATMAERDFAGFVSFLADETVFFAGEKPLKGKQTVADAWQTFYEGDAAPFSWSPEQVVVLESGTLALSTGPVNDPAGKRVATFTSIWRQEAPGVWKIVFDKGCEFCDCSNTDP
jgi:ketosteroid isomerase-like protein